MIVPYILKNKKCSKPQTSEACADLTHEGVCSGTKLLDKCFRDHQRDRQLVLWYGSGVLGLSLFSGAVIKLDSTKAKVLKLTYLWMSLVYYCLFQHIRPEKTARSFGSRISEVPSLVWLLLLNTCTLQSPALHKLKQHIQTIRYTYHQRMNEITGKTQ